jgi:hypothetical protein
MESSLADFRKDISIYVYNEAGQVALVLQRVPLLGVRIDHPPRPRRQRRSRRHSVHPAPKRGLGTGLPGKGTEGAVLQHSRMTVSRENPFRDGRPIHHRRTQRPLRRRHPPVVGRRRVPRPGSPVLGDPSLVSGRGSVFPNPPGAARPGQRPPPAHSPEAVRIALSHPRSLPALHRNPRVQHQRGVHAGGTPSTPRGGPTRTTLRGVEPSTATLVPPGSYRVPARCIPRRKRPPSDGPHRD